MFVCGLLLASFVFTGCETLSSGPVNDSPTTATQVALFQIGDTVVVNLSGPPDAIPPHEEPIKEDGTITMPYIGAVQALGKTAGQLQKDIHDLYVPKYYNQLTVTVKSSQDRVYYVGGEVKQPNRYVYTGTTTVTKAIQSAGDFTNFGSHRVWLIRANGQRVKVDCDKALKDPKLDLPVYPGDQIQVPKRTF
jgi:polysaccharide export outer membrane protein